MTDKFEEQEALNTRKSIQRLTVKEKLFFGLVCWGVQSWSQAKSFETNGYFQKYIDSKKAMHIGLVVYGTGITLYILLLFYIRNYSAI